uniref:Decapping nuclease DXO homologic-like isoform X1 n=1 Tax=Rhizophora mucronata TaxID=61149 RepID=A0A2P2M324_RHIMU
MKGLTLLWKKTELGSQGFGDLLACIRDKNIPLQNMHFAAFRNNFNKVIVDPSHWTYSTKYYCTLTDYLLSPSDYNTQTIYLP